MVGHDPYRAHVPGLVARIVQEASDAGTTAETADRLPVELADVLTVDELADWAWFFDPWGETAGVITATRFEYLEVVSGILAGG